jgi:hypothetical protein
MKLIFVFTLILVGFFICNSGFVFGVFAQPVDGLSIQVVLSVEGTIDTYDDDPGVLLDPMYYIWIDGNGNPADGGYGNGAGSYQTGIQLGAEWSQIDSPRLHFWGPRIDGIDGTGDDEDFYLSENVVGVSRTWSGNDVDANISPDGSSLIVSFPLSKIGSPSTLEVSFMCAMSTSASLDNLHPTVALDSGFQGWIGYPDSIDATQAGFFSKDDDPNEVLSSDFNIISASVEIYEPTITPEFMRDSPPIWIILPVAGIVIGLTAFLLSIGPSFDSAISNLPVPKQVRSFMKIYAAGLFQKVDKIKLELLRKRPLLSFEELISLGVAILLLAFVYGVASANGFVNFLNLEVMGAVIPSTFLSSGIVVITKVLSNAYWSYNFKVYKKFSLWFIGLLMFVVSGLLFLFPFSSPSITRYQSSQISKEKKALLILFKTFTFLSLMIPFSILFMLDFEVLGDSGMLLTLMSTFYSLVPIKMLAGKVLFDYKKDLSLVMLVCLGVLFFGATLNLLPSVVFLIAGVISAIIALMSRKKLENTAI